MKTFTMELAGRTLRVDRLTEQLLSNMVIQLFFLLLQLQINLEMALISSHFQLSLKKRHMLLVKSQEDLIKERVRLRKILFLLLVLLIDLCVHFSQRITVTMLHLITWLWLLILSVVQSLLQCLVLQ